MTTIQTPEFHLAWRFVNETRQNIFLTGKAGTGKTTFLRYLREHSQKAIVVAAPTGIAAINAGGVTLHSFFQLPLSPYIPVRDELGNSINAPGLLSRLRYNRQKLDILRKLELLVIDEASMVAGHTLDAVDTILRSVRRRAQLPFGGVQVLFIGDLHQLQPVVKQEEWMLLRPYYPSPFFFDSEVLRQHPPIQVELKKVFRQKDETFIAILNEIRHNQLTAAHLRLLNERLRPGFMPGKEEGYVTLTTHNAQAEEMNRKLLAALDGKRATYRAEVEGDFPESQFPADPNLELKVGAQVMFLRNDNEGKRFFNGKIGVITALHEESVSVRCEGESEEIMVLATEWTNTSYEVNQETKELDAIPKGVFRQLPLRLAWAITIHKSQGLTFDKVIVDAERAFANGQVYVALSRCTSLDGLILTSPISQRFLGAHEDLDKWQQSQPAEDQLGATLEKARHAFMQQELAGAFDLQPWRKELAGLKRMLQENDGMITGPWEEWWEELNKLQQEADNVSKKFQHQLNDLILSQPDAEQNAPLQERVKAAAKWFWQQTLHWLEKYQNIPFKVRTLAEAREIQESLDDLHELVQDYAHSFLHLTEGFMLDKFLREGKQRKRESPALPSIYEKAKKTVKATEVDATHPALLARLRAWRSQQMAGRQPAFKVMSNATLVAICEMLPGNLAALQKVKGIGKRKAAQFGEELLQMVRDYCEDKDVEATMEAEKPAKQRKDQPKVDTVKATLELFRQGKSVPEIAAERGYATTTIEGHLTKSVERGELKVEDLLDPEVLQYLQANLPSAQMTLSEWKSQLREDITFGQMRLVIAAQARIASSGD